MSDNWQQNVKQVFRIAIVGLKPSIQVKVKGYLRLILRMDFDLEWVQPKNPNVNLYIISPKFADSDALAMLLAESGNIDTPMLFADKVAEKEDVIEGNMLYLPLTKVSVLEEWLHRQVPIVGHKGSFVQSEFAKSQPTAVPQQPKPVEPILTEEVPVFADEPKTPPVIPATNTVSQAPNEQPLKKEESYSDVFAPDIADDNSGVFEADLFADASLNENTLAFIDLIYQSSEDAFFEVLDEGDVVAVINPKHAYVWPSTDGFYVAYSLNWRVRKIYRADINATEPHNLNTWIWQKAMEQGSPVSEVLPLTARVSIAGRPNLNVADANYPIYKNIFRRLNTELSSGEVAELCQLEHEFVHQCMAALYVAGFLNMSQYVTPSSLARLHME